MLKAGDKAPEFNLPNQDGDGVSLACLRGKKVLIWFFPRANTPGCTAQGCSLRNHYADLQSQGVEILGISKDSVERQQKFVKRWSFPYALLADESGEVIEAFGAWGRRKFMGFAYERTLRVSFLLDEEGTITEVFSKVKVRTHGPDVLAAL